VVKKLQGKHENIKTEINVQGNKSPLSADTNEMSFKCQFTGDVKTA